MAITAEKVISKVKSFQKVGQTQRSEVKNLGTHEKALSQGILM